MKSDPKQAVVIIHGIGEQRPMSTVRGFADSVLPSSGDGRRKYWSRPDRISGSHELRMLRAPARRGRQPTTDFYECYWAYMMRDNKMRHVLAWIRRLLFASPRRIPRRLLWVWALIWVGLVVGALGFAAFGTGWYQGFTELAAASLIVAGIASLTLGLTKAWVLDYLGDVARYLMPAPENILQRKAVRDQALTVLRRLHECGHYDRIIVVGHSLGSVIAYDAIRHLWDDYRCTHGRPTELNQTQLHRCEVLGTELWACQVAGDRPPQERERLQREFRECQRELWKEMRKLGNKWLVSDFVTVGSPLAHAEYFMADSFEDLELMRSEREMPCCPPLPEAVDGHGERVTREVPVSFTYKQRYNTEDGQKRTIRVPVESAPFACVRWTNVFYRGDLAGGPVGPVFGPGVRDYIIRAQRGDRLWWRVRTWLPLSHTHYWRKAGPDSDTYAEREAVRRLRGGMDFTQEKLLAEMVGFRLDLDEERSQ